jgi:peptide/nickel transport system ATP-binding protein
LSALLEIIDLSIAIPGDGDRSFAVEHLNLSLQQGEILCIVGESGSGKSMCANAVMGLLPPHMKPSSGQIQFDGQDLLELSDEQMRAMRGTSISMIFQEPLSALNPVMRVGDQIAEVLQVHGITASQRVRTRVLELMGLVGLPDPVTTQHSYPFRLSGGQRQRVMIAMALALEPKILIADEPTTALDVTTQAQILKLIRTIQRGVPDGEQGVDSPGVPAVTRHAGMGVMFITHDFGVVAEIADRVAVMEKGVLVEVGPVEQILYAPVHPYTKRLIAAVPRRSTEHRAVLAGHGALLEVKNLKKVYGAQARWFGARRVVAAVDDVSFSIQRGETLGIVGESGSGKSTVARCILKLTDVDAGQILYQGQDIALLSAHQFRPMRRDIQMVFQDPFASINPRHTVGRIISDGPVASGQSRAAAETRARQLLALVGLEVSAFARYPNEFSGGQRQRIGIARALALDPKILVADEPVSALDVSVQAQVLALLRDLQQRLDLALIFITHDLRVAAQICVAVLVMHHGRVVERGTPEEIFDRPSDSYTQRLVAAVPGQAWNPTKSVASTFNGGVS